MVVWTFVLLVQFSFLGFLLHICHVLIIEVVKLAMRCEANGSRYDPCRTIQQEMFGGCIMRLRVKTLSSWHYLSLWLWKQHSPRWESKRSGSSGSQHGTLVTK
jgi:hypothetical protein